MSKIYTSVRDMVGGTPLIEPKRFNEANGLKARLLGKLESKNPGGSVKDRVAAMMITDAEERGILQPGGVIIEPTSGNTGIGLASVGTALGYKVIIVMPESMSMERRMLVTAYGAELVLTPKSEGMQGAVNKAKELAASMPGSFIPDQFNNPANAKAHYLTTGPEIWADTDGQVDIFVAGIGTGGTITGVGQYLKEKNPNAKVVAVEPERSPLLSKGVAGPHAIQGIGANFVPGVLNREVYDEIITVSDDNAFASARQLGKTDGVLVGISGGAALWAGLQLAQRPENEGKTIVVLLPDSGERYLSTDLYK